jgi:hypothetical protein
MISAFIFFAHLIFITFIFTKKWQTESLSAAFINAALIIILFTVGWSLTVMISKAIMEKEGFGFFFDRDTFALVILTITEFFFYRMYYGKEVVNPDETEKQ